MHSDDTHQLDPTVRRLVYQHFLEHERPPTATETAEAVGTSPAQVQAAYQRLARDHILALAPPGHEIRMAAPFSAVPTAFRIKTADHAWWANCALDALGVPVMLGTDASVLSICGDCEEPLGIEVRNGQLLEASGVIHFAVPVARCYDDLIFT